MPKASVPQREASVADACIANKNARRKNNARMVTLYLNMSSRFVIMLQPVCIHCCLSFLLLRLIMSTPTSTSDEPAICSSEMLSPRIEYAI